MQIAAQSGGAEKDSLPAALQRVGTPLLNLLLHQDEGVPHRVQPCAAVMMPSPSPDPDDEEEEVKVKSGPSRALRIWVAPYWGYSSQVGSHTLSAAIFRLP